ncbi:hypothetical protein DAT1711_02750 [Enterococcus cecorum]|nr:hypothetical protein CIRMBP1308_01547 [Enterococcus cecorum]
MIDECFKLDVRIYYLQYYARSFSNFLSAKQYQLSCLHICISLAGLTVHAPFNIH